MSQNLVQVLKKILNFFGHLVALTVIGVTVFKIGNFLGLLTGFPKGLDSYVYLFRIKFVDRFFPHIFWNPFWDSGVPMFTWSHPPLTTFLAVVFHRFFGLTIPQSLSGLAFLGMVLLGIGVFGIIAEAVQIWSLGLVTVILLLLTNGIWGWWADGGNYPRIVGMGFWAVFAFFLIGYLRAKKLEQKTKWWWLGAVVNLHLCLASHFLTGGFGLVFGGLMILLAGGRGRLREIFKVIGVGWLSAFYWYGPLFSTGHQAGSFLGGGVNQGAILPQNFFGLDHLQPYYSWFEGFSYFVIGGGVIIILALIISLFIPRARKFLFGGLLGFGLIITLSALIFYEIANLFAWYPDSLFIDGLPALSAFFLTSLLAVLVVGMGAGLFLSVFPWRWLREILGLVLLLGLVFFYPLILISINTARGEVRDVSDQVGEGKSWERLPPDLSFRKLLLGREREKNFRFGTDTAYVSGWWNYEYLDYPQTKDYFAQGVTYPSWQFWLENAVWKDEENYGETNFLLDWYGIKNFLVAIPNAKTKKFLKRTDDYQKLACLEVAKENACEFEFKGATPILLATNTPAVLVIGRPDSYETLFRSWAKTGLGSKEVIFIKGGEKLGGLTAVDPTGFDAVFLYGYQSDPVSLSSKLKNFVENGGSLYIESNRDKEIGTNLPDPFPVLTVEKKLIEGNWSFSSGKGLAKEIDWQQFSPPQYENSGWGVGLATGIKNWAQSLVSVNGKSLIVAGNLGKGKVVWSGLNLPFHQLTYKNEEELKLLKEIVLWLLLDKQKRPAVSYAAETFHPQKFAITVDNSTKGILFKEAYLSPWQARIGRKRVPLWRAGPDLMYINLIGVKKFPINVEFTYHLFWQEKISLLISILTIAGIIDWWRGGRFLKKIEKIKLGFSKSIKGDEENY